MTGERPAPPRYAREAFGAGGRFTVIGEGEPGGKAAGLGLLQRALAERFDASAHAWADVDIPTMSVVCTRVFESFLDRNGLREAALSGDPDDRIAHAFQRASLPVEILGDLKALIDQVRLPLAVRSSSLLEDALQCPFAGVYATKMIPNNQPERDVRFQRLTEAIKLVYASAFFGRAREYQRGTGRDAADERMAAILQEVVGARHGDRFYPTLSGVARSLNYFPQGGSRPEEGVTSLALGLGKTIVDGGIVWTYCPARPAAAPPFASASDLLERTQLAFWAVNMGRPPEQDPVAETEYLVQSGLAEAELDGTLDLLASTYAAGSDRMVPGLSAEGPRALTFAPLLVHREYPLNDLVRELLAICEEASGGPVEIEFAASFPRERGRRVRFAMLQVRPMAGPGEAVEVRDEDLAQPGLLLASRIAIGNGERRDLADVVYVRPEAFEPRHTRLVAEEIRRANALLVSQGRPYLLIGFGRWGSADPWLGIPVQWGEIGGARAIVEAAAGGMAVEPSQGSHFFHNLIAFGVPYLTVGPGARPGIDWAWLDSRPAVREDRFVRTVRLDRPLVVRVDGRSGRAGVWRGPEAP